MLIKYTSGKTKKAVKLIENVRFGKTEDAYNGFTKLVTDAIETGNCRRILDLGGGANPHFALSDPVLTGREYTIADRSEGELNRAPDGYTKIVMDIAGEMQVQTQKYDLVFSRFVVEHVADAEKLHANVFQLLNPGGVAIHFFPTLFALPFLVNKLLPEGISVLLLSQERQERGKFPAFYHWCVGPSRAAVKRLKKLGYEVVEYAGFFGHGYYDRFMLLKRMHLAMRLALLKYPVGTFTSFAWVVLRKPRDGENARA